MYRIGTGEKTYKDGRNDDIDIAEFSFNEQSYLNSANHIRLIIHSLDTLNGNEERVVFELEDIQKKESLDTYIDYMNRKNKLFSNSEIQFMNDSIYLWRGLYSDEKTLIFKG